jgi:TRAP-type C4-dicarboxylate transport system substrate-binding protein
MNLLKSLAVAAAVAITVPHAAWAQTTHKLTIASGQPPVFPYISLLRDYFVPEVDKRLASTPHRIQWTQAYAGTVMKIGSEIESIKDGLVDIGFVLLTNNESKLPLHAFTYFAPFTSTDPEVTVKAYNQTQRGVKEMTDAWDKNNQVYLATVAIESFNMYSKKPVKSLEDLKGLKVGVIGPNANWLRNSGAVPVTFNLASIYNDLQSGIFDAALLADSVAASLKLHEAGPYRTQWDLGSFVFAALTINKDRWNALPAEVKGVLTAVSQDYEARVISEMRTRGREGVAAMVKAGLTNVDPGVEGRRAWANAMPNLAKDWATGRRERASSAPNVIPAYLKSVREAGVTPLRDWAAN